MNCGGCDDREAQPRERKLRGSDGKNARSKLRGSDRKPAKRKKTMAIALEEIDECIGPTTGKNYGHIAKHDVVTIDRKDFQKDKRFVKLTQESMKMAR